MAPSALNPESSSSAPEPTNHSAETESSRPLDRALLEKVLQETLSAAHHPASPGGGPALEPLREVARRLRGQPLAEPVVIELVSALLKGSFPKIREGSREFRTMSARIAQTLLDDPVARDRLKAFWGRLTESDR